jgi:hypothetical protein
MIAVGHSQSYQFVSSSELQTYNKLGVTYFCKARNVLLTDLTKTCLGALYLADAKNIQNNCKFSIGGAQEKIFRLDSNTYKEAKEGPLNHWTFTTPGTMIGGAILSLLLIFCC